MLYNEEVPGSPIAPAETIESWGIMYENTSPMVNFYLDDETGLISGFALMSDG